MVLLLMGYLVYTVVVYYLKMKQFENYRHSIVCIYLIGQGMSFIISVLKSLPSYCFMKHDTIEYVVQMLLKRFML
jgi:hypothetical protein